MRSIRDRGVVCHEKEKVKNKKQKAKRSPGRIRKEKAGASRIGEGVQNAKGRFAPLFYLHNRKLAVVELGVKSAGL